MKTRKWDSLFLKIWQFSHHPFNCRKLGPVQLSSNFFLLLLLISYSRANCQTNFRFFQTDIFNKVLFQMRNLFTAYSGDS